MVMRPSNGRESGCAELMLWSRGRRYDESRVANLATLLDRGFAKLAKAQGWGLIPHLQGIRQPGDKCETVSLLKTETVSVLPGSLSIHARPRQLRGMSLWAGVAAEKSTAGQ